MKLFYAILILLCIGGTFGKDKVQEPRLKCSLRSPNITNSWIDMVTPCIKKLKDQVQVEFNASMEYLSMAAHFARDTVNRPGFSKFFFESASEEREHGIKVIEYLLMRGQLTNDVSKLIKFPLIVNNTELNGKKALTEALKLEAKVTRSIREIIKACEDEPAFNDYHLVDYLITDFLDEQYKAQRDLAGKISVLSKLMQTHGSLGEFLFDKKLLNGEV